MSDQTYHCNCQAVSFALSEPVTDLYVCHCSICRMSNGSANKPVAIVANNSFRWLKGQALIKTWQKPGHDWITCFCSHCGTPLPGKNSPSTMFIPAALITQGNPNLVIKHHIWVGSKASWEVIGDKGKQHQNAFTAE